MKAPHDAHLTHRQDSRLPFLTLITFFALFSFAAASQPDDMEVLFQQGLRERGEKKYYDSLKSFQKIIEKQPKLHRARLELAVAHYKVLDFDKAHQEAQIVLDDPETPQNVKIAILAFLAQAKNDAGRLQGSHDWRMEATAGFLHDSNVNAGPTSDRIPGTNLIITPEGLPREDTAKVLALSFNDTYITGKTLPLWQSPMALIWRNGIDLTHRGYLHEDQFNLNTISFSTGPGLMDVDKIWRAEVLFQDDIIILGEDKLADFFSVLPQISWHPKSETEFVASGTVSRRLYDRPVDDARGRDSWYWGSSLAVNHLFPGDTVMLEGGVELFLESANKDISSNDGIGLFSGFYWKVLEKTSLYARINMQDTEFVGIEPGFETMRDERQLRMTAGAKQIINKEENYLWFVQANSVYTENDSNVSLYDYHRWQHYLLLNGIF